MRNGVLLLNRAARLKGWKAQKDGAFFEGLLEARASGHGISCLRFPDGCRKIPGPGGRPRLIPKKSPFDFVLGLGSKVCFLDTKSFDSDRIVYSALVPHQIKSLALLSKHQKAGYLCFLRAINEVVFFEAAQLALLQPRQSLEANRGLGLGSFETFDLGLLFR